ncbi:MAG: PAS domain S-box protein, partial [Candidatus Thermoplasmatota archaeon]|nr:PAS domain S-box protein [Candidatus Thermoplasmatota archaeon]
TKKSALKIIPILQKIIQGKSVPIIDVDGVTKKEDIVPYELRAVPLFKDGKVVAAQAILRNISERKENEKTLKESEHKFRSLVEQAAEMLFLHKINGQIVDVNQAAEKNTEYSRQELLSMTVFDIDPDALDQKYKKQYWQQMQPHDAPLTVDGRHKRKDGSIYPAEITISKVEISNNEYILALARDITERKKAEEELKDREEKFRLLAENSVDCIWMLDKKLKFTYLSPSLEQLTGCKPKEWIGTKLRNHFRKKEFLRIGFIVAKALKNYKNFKPLTFETKILNKENKEIDVEITGNVLLDENGKLKGLQGATRDISERKKAEKKIIENERKYRELFNNALVGISVHKSDGGILAVNAAAEKIFGFNEAELMEKTVDFWYGKLINADGMVMKITDYPLSVVAESKTPSERRVIGLKMRKEGDIRWFLHIARPILDENEEIEKVITSFVEITERKYAQQKLKAAHENLKELNKNLEEIVEERTDRIQQILQQKDEFINQLGHDLKNPLGPFMHLLPILKDHVSSEKDKQMIGVLERNANYMKNLVKKTIDLAKLNSSKTKFSFEDISLDDLVDEVIFVNTSFFSNHTVGIKNNVSSDCLVHVDPLHIQEVFTNLFNNAVKYSNDERWIGIDASEKDDCVLVSVRDKGIGISNEQLPCLFDEYYKADSSRHDFDSSGLGLPICKRIIEKHSGKIWAESEGLGKGSTFYFTLPKSKKGD